MWIYGTVLQVMHIFYSQGKELTCNLEQQPDHVQLPEFLSPKLTSMCVLDRIKQTIVISIFKLVGEGKLLLRMLDSGKAVMIAMIEVSLLRAISNTIVERLRKDNFRGRSIADRHGEVCGPYRQTHTLLRYYWGQWKASRSFSRDKWNSFATLPLWEHDDVTQYGRHTSTRDPVAVTRVAKSIISIDEAFDTNGKNGSIPSSKAWLAASTDTGGQDSKQVTNTSDSSVGFFAGTGASEDQAKCNIFMFDTRQNKHPHPSGRYQTSKSHRRVQGLLARDDRGRLIKTPIQKQDVPVKCHTCFEFHIWCDGERPCGFCTKFGRQCREQSEERQSETIKNQDLQTTPNSRTKLPDNGRPRPYRKQRKDGSHGPQTTCAVCYTARAQCDGERPCGYCIQSKRRCREQGEKVQSQGQNPSRKC